MPLRTFGSTTRHTVDWERNFPIQLTGWGLLGRPPAIQLTGRGVFPIQLTGMVRSPAGAGRERWSYRVVSL